MNTNIKTVDQYLKLFPKDVSLRLKKIRDIVQKAAPKAEEKISYGMPAYKLNGILVYFAAYKNHIGFYPMKKVIVSFKKELVNHKTSKGTVQFPHDKPLPVGLITKMVKMRVKENLEKNKIKIKKV